MGKTFDALQEVMKKQEAMRHSERALASPVLPSGTKTELDTGREKEVYPMDGDYNEYPPLDRARLRDGYQLCLASARRLLNDAASLRDAGHVRTGYLILSLAVEELGKAMQLYEAGRAGVRNWEAWWRRYFRHPREQDAPSLDMPGMQDERFARVRAELMYVDFDRKHERFIGPRADEDTELLQLFDQETAHAEAMVKTLPSYAFERWEFEEMVQQSPEIAAPVLYARIEELVSQEPAASEKDLLTAVAQDLGMSPDDFTGGFERWKKASRKARTYTDLLQRVQARLKEERRAEGTG